MTARVFNRIMNGVMEAMTYVSPMSFAFHAHRDHKRKYTGHPYTDHLAEKAAMLDVLTEADAELRAIARRLAVQ